MKCYASYSIIIVKGRISLNIACTVKSKLLEQIKIKGCSDK